MEQWQKLTTDIPFYCPTYYSREPLPPSEESLEEDPDELRPLPLEDSRFFLDTSFFIPPAAEAEPLLEEPLDELPEPSSLLREDDLPPLSEERPASSSFFLRF